MGNRLSGKVAIVTGAGTGIGAATCRKLVEEGARVVVADIAIDSAEAIASELGDDASAAWFDAEQPQTIEALVNGTVERHGRLDVLHNNAALTTPEIQGADTTAVDIDVEVWDRVMAVNLRGYLLGCKFAVPHMASVGGGSIINTASDSGLVGDVVRIAYGTSKGAILTLTRYVATQFGRQGVRCNAIAPGLILTPALVTNAPELIEMLSRHVVLSRHGRAEDIANLACFLASDESSFITGQVISCDGGFLIKAPHYADVLGAPSESVDG
jgi:NAD(P)-dependent dehydrogenase (short-subunit alcohol dehydrogenase family)